MKKQSDRMARQIKINIKTDNSFETLADEKIITRSQKISENGKIFTTTEKDKDENFTMS